MRRLALAVLHLCFVSTLAIAQAPATAASANPEARATRAFNAARAAGPLQLHAFLANMPKGADLHMHLGGAVYAESFIAQAAADRLCVNTTTFSFTKNVGTTRSIPPQPVCAAGGVPAASAFGPDPKAQRLYDALINSFSMRSFVPTPGTSGHDQFFATFARFGGTSKSHAGEWLDEVASRGAAQNEQYIELMDTPDFSHAARIAHDIGWNDDLG